MAVPDLASAEGRVREGEGEGGGGRGITAWNFALLVTYGCTSVLPYFLFALNAFFFLVDRIRFD